MSSLDEDGNEVKDGFRKRKKRPAGWLKAAIKDGSVREPGAPDPDEGKDYRNNYVIEVPGATAGADGTPA